MGKRNSTLLLGDEAYEITYYALNFLFGQIWGVDYSVFLSLQALLIYSLLWIAIRRDCRYPMFSLLCLYVTLGNGGIFFVRQTIAVVLIFFSYHYIKNKELKKFFLCILLAMCFHRASLIALPLYLIFNAKYTTKSFFYAVILGSLFILLAYFGYLNTALNKFVDYKDEGNHGVSVLQFYYGTMNKILYLLVFLLFMPQKKDNGQSKREINGLINIYIYGLFLYVFWGSINITLSRLSNFINIIMVYQVSVWLFNSRNYNKKRLLAIIFIFMFVIRSLFSVSEYQDLFVPYKSIFNKNMPVKVY